MSITEPSSAFCHPVSVEFEDVDSYGLAHHTKIIAYLERARVHFFAGHGLDIKNLAFGLILVDLHMRFRQPLHLLDRVCVEVRVQSLGRVRFVWDYTIVKDGAVAVQAQLEQTTVDLATKRPIAIPPEVRALLAPLLIRS